MEKFSGKIEIINHFDNLINRLDIDIDDSLEKCDNKQLLDDLVRSSETNRKYFRTKFDHFNLEFFERYNSSSKHESPLVLSTKVVDYLNQVRTKTIDELRKAQNETLKYYSDNSTRFKSELTEKKNIDELKSELYAEKYYFQVHLKQSEKRLWAFNVFTFVTDFYLSQFHIDSLEKLINAEKEPFGPDPIIDNNAVLTGLLYKCFIVNLLNFPAHLIHVCKRDVLNIKTIDMGHKYSGVNIISSSTVDLSKLVNLFLTDRADLNRCQSSKFNLEGLSSLKFLHLAANSAEVDFSFRNLNSLRHFYMNITCKIDENMMTRILEQIPTIEELYLHGNISYINLDRLVNLRELSIAGTIDTENFNFDLLKNLCKQLEKLKIVLVNLDEKSFFKLFDGCNFPYLVYFVLRFFNVKRLKKEYINRFPTLKQLYIVDCSIETIETDSFSNLEQLCWLNLNRNQIEFIEENAFKPLKNLQTIDLRKNKFDLENFDPKFVGLKESAKFTIDIIEIGHKRVFLRKNL